MSANELVEEAKEETYEVNSGQLISKAIVTAVADASGCQAVKKVEGEPHTGETLDPLYHAIDPDALDTLFSSNKIKREDDI